MAFPHLASQLLYYSALRIVYSVPLFPGRDDSLLVAVTR
jgi:hypothetical protein